MVPACRTDGEELSFPKFTLEREDVEGFLHEWRGFHEAFRDCFTRREPRAHFLRSMVGPCSPLERQSIAPMALEVEAGHVRGMQRFMRDEVWDEAQMRRIDHGLVDADIRASDGVVMVDESGFPKKGNESVGVARQSCGALGQVENCQVGVFAAYASRQGSALLNQRLLLPEPWLTDAYARRRAKSSGPEDLAFQPKPQLAGAMIRELYEEGILPFKSVGADGLDGQSTDFRDAVEPCPGLTSRVAMPADTRGWLPGPVMADTGSRDHGATRTTRPVAPTASAPLTVEALATSLQQTFWYPRPVSEGTQGAM